MRGRDGVKTGASYGQGRRTILLPGEDPNDLTRGQIIPFLSSECKRTFS